MIQIHDLALDAADGNLLLEGVRLSVARGGRQLVTGPSGSGKSRLLRVVAGTERPARGRVTVDGRDLWPGEGAFAHMGRLSLGLAFATGGLLSNLSLRENVALPLRMRGTAGQDWAARTDAALHRLGLQAVAGLRPHAVSAAARKHANLARVLALDPDLILLDDPLEGLDAADHSVALEVIHGWVSRGKTLLVAQEEPGALAALATERLDLHAHLIPWGTP
ncbi:ATP-binding cassette domain-containing protein [Geothrix sp. PMB-07]|uniref:ATP-binding cassette domain-containing protein n=1 Tax=Geothrix sp. PMB-07 TaxID=3068640 RepID=UPI002741DBC7|nr:ATP-binding cassette domain-containing protein [Geothrix sp. PMB-07]WLT30333.1 ATP-binding cassette domain-containing protein [Geothrix sp. PMB-07]